MKIPIEEIDKVSHVLIVVDNNSFALGSALYTYVLTLHKKVSLSSKETLESNLSFLPWFDKVRATSSTSADLVIELGCDVKLFFDSLKEQKIKINKKMATALYTALLMKYNNFKSDDSDGIVFAIASELIALGAEYKVCREYLQRKVPLSAIRLRATMYKSLLLKDDATKAELFICDEELKASGASINDAREVLEDILTLVNVKEVTLYKSDEKNKILETLKEI
ncbi:MAG: hypothetical protein U9O86_09490 [Campylobacterota bacterium]|nr:hypothetical protein [Campylobacterota bacterium]